MQTQGGIEFDLAESFGFGVKNSSARDFDLHHFFKAQRLGTELDVVIDPLAPPTDFEFDRKERAVGPLFDDVALAVEPEVFGPNREGAQEGDAFGDLIAGKVGVFVSDIPALRVGIGRANPLDHFQRRPPGTVEKVVYEGKGERLSLELKTLQFELIA